MDIRLLSKKHAAVYKSLRLKALQEHPEAFSSSYEEEVTFSIATIEKRLSVENSFTFGAFVDEKLVAVITLLPETKNKLKHRANIVAVYVSTGYRKAGIGQKLVEAAINKSKSIEGIEQLYLTVSSSNIAAKNLYQSFGFKTFGIDKKALKVKETYYDEELMVLYL
ncbi:MULTISPECIES: GNAT family N-acetyltransferase [Bacillaceae]|uniref:GNAT family N-acetyltransferase n=1 Tax=Bacillaceae TaxID=186817 RepID=UPI000BFE278D|nr:MULTISPECIES: GNAT family N-acetyltransferase [Bacillaceae]PGT84446.1 GNAT family N-acetyltransferase [Bacillus sp. AFS040349]UGB32957.1 GNAT family N-acetyltransferase [Metabacillus sp. B2-18]